jgi:hypothetical protein
MRIEHRRRLALGTVLTSVATLLSLFAIVAPAQAYGSLTVRYVLVDTDDCRVIERQGNLPVVAQSTRCFLDDSADNTYFTKDPGGVAIKIELHDGNGMVAKQEFHPHGEHLWVYDTRNDSDTVYTELRVNNRFYDVYSPPGTSSVLDFRDFNLSFDEGDSIGLWIWDEYPVQDSIVLVSGGRA